MRVLLALSFCVQAAAYAPSSERSLNVQGQQQAAQLLGRVLEHATKNPHLTSEADATLYPHLANAASEGLGLQEASDASLDEAVTSPALRLRGGGYSGAGKLDCGVANSSSRSARLPQW